MRARMALTLALLVAVLPGILPTATLALDDLDRVIGEKLFRRNWVTAPSSTRANDGLGPLFNARSCAECHPGAGRASAALDAQGRPGGSGVVLRLLGPQGAPDPNYGRQLQTSAAGVAAEGSVVVQLEAAAHGLRRRMPTIASPGYGPLDPQTALSLRVAPDLRGRAAFDRVAAETILALEDPDDRDGDGVRGRARRIPKADGSSEVGRHGWKAETASMPDQVGLAFALDLGLSTARFPEPWGDCTATQAACRSAPHGARSEGEVEIDDRIFARIVAFLRRLDAPTPVANTPGEALFAATGCAACHRPRLSARDGSEVRAFSDLLLHDLGPGLADPADDTGARASEWRTAPLIGLGAAMARRTGLLHDGRAASVAEAIRQHGGEAAGSVKKFHALGAAERKALIAYVSSL